MRRSIASVFVGLLVGVWALPAMASENPAVWVAPAHDVVWNFDFEHTNPCTGEFVVVSWSAEHRTTTVDWDGVGETRGDQILSVGVMEISSVTGLEEGWELLAAGDALNQVRWDQNGAFGDDDQATVVYRSWFKATNPTTGDWYQWRTVLTWISNAQGTTVVEENVWRTTGCMRSGQP